MVIGRNTADPCTMEALQGRHRGSLVDRCARQRQLPKDVGDPRKRDEPHVDRRARLFPERRRGRGQSLLDPSGRQRHAAPYRPRRFLRAPRADRRQALRVSMRRGHHVYDVAAAARAS
jgi:hypothetical protein